jgi:hypothetical protein
LRRTAAGGRRNAGKLRDAESRQSPTPRGGAVRGLLDFTAVDAIDIAQARLAERARQPQIAAGQERVFVVSEPALMSMAERYAATQGAFGNMAPRIVGTLAEAYTLLAMDRPEFEVIKPA